MRKGASAKRRAGSLKTRCRGSSRSTLPCFLLFPENGFPGPGSYSHERDTALLFPMSITAGLATHPTRPPDRQAVIVVSCCGRDVCPASADLVASATLSRAMAAKQIRFYEFGW